MKHCAAIAALAACALSLSVPALRADATDNRPLLKRGATIKLSGSTGKSDFSEIDPVYHRLLGGHQKDGTADFYDLDTNKLIVRVEARNAVDIVLIPKLDKYFVSGSTENKVLVIDAKTFKVTDEIPMPGGLDGLLYDATNDRIYVANDEGTHIWAIDPNTLKLVGDTPVIGVPEYMVYDPRVDRIYLNSKTTDEIYSIDPNKNEVVATWSIKPTKGPHGLAFDPKTNRLFPAGANGKMAVLDASTGRLVTTVSIAPSADQNVFDPGTRRIYCACAGMISVVRETDDGAEFLGNVPTNSTAKNLAVDPKTHSVWTCYTDGKDAYAQEFIPQ